MKLRKIDKIHEGRFITRYDLTYETAKGNEKVYEMISRNKNIDCEEALKGKDPEAVVIIVFDEDKEHILINKEFRMPTGQWIYNFPAGLIDEGEDAKAAAARELREETGLELIAIDDVIGVSYSAIGFSNEKNICVVGRAKGTFRLSDSEFEEIEQGWYSKEEVAKLLKTEFFAARTQAFCYMWSRS